MDTFDVVYCPYHRWHIDHLLPWEKTLGSLRAQWLFPETKRSPQREEIELVNKYRAYHFVNKKNYEEYAPHCHDAWLLTNPVNTERFECTQIKDRVVASWNGNAGHSNSLDRDVKGFFSIVQPACEKAGVELVFAEATLCRWQPEEMPDFYLQGNVALCASLYEGASNSVMEAMAAGQALIVTDVGNHRDMRESQLKEYGDTGIILVERNVASFVEALQGLKRRPDRVAEMGRLNRLECERAWSWKAWIEQYAAFLRLGIAK